MRIERNVLRSALIGAVVLSTVIGSTTASAATVKISKKKLTMTVGEKKKLKVKGTTQKVKWSSSKKSVASVSKKGVVIAKKAGKAKITAKIGKKKYTCKVTVKAPTAPVQTATAPVQPVTEKPEEPHTIFTENITLDHPGEAITVYVSSDTDWVNVYEKDSDVVSVETDYPENGKHPIILKARNKGSTVVDVKDPEGKMLGVINVTVTNPAISVSATSVDVYEQAVINVKVLGDANVDAYILSSSAECEIGERNGNVVPITVTGLEKNQVKLEIYNDLSGEHCTVELNIVEPINYAHIELPSLPLTITGYEYDYDENLIPGTQLTITNLTIEARSDSRRRSSIWIDYEGVGSYVREPGTRTYVNYEWKLFKDGNLFVKGWDSTDQVALGEHFSGIFYVGDYLPEGNYTLTIESYVE